MIVVRDTFLTVPKPCVPHSLAVVIQGSDKPFVVCRKFSTTDNLMHFALYLSRLKPARLFEREVIMSVPFMYDEHNKLTLGYISRNGWLQWLLQSLNVWHAIINT